MRRTFSLRVVGVALILIATAGLALAATFPAGFTDTLLVRINDPIAMDVTPDGRMLITNQAGELMIYVDGAVLKTPALNLKNVTCSDKERGMLGIAVDPAFASNRYIYVYYTFDKYATKADADRANDCPRQESTQRPVNRLSRFVLGDDNRVDPASEKVLLDNIFSINANHDGGGLRFGKDGYLYIAIGDGGCDYADVQSCQANNDSSRDMHILNGKVLRITRDGGIPPDNPFRGAGTARCYDPAPGGNKRGLANPGQICQEAFAVGLRNPFRMAFDAEAATTRFFINDVGQYNFEEINEGRAGADYGWNCYEAERRNSSKGLCVSPSGMTGPIYSYNHNTGCKAVTAAAFVPRGVWPAEYDGAYIFSDYQCGKLFTLRQGSDGQYQASEFTPAGVSGIDMLFAPYENTQALYYITYNAGQRPNGELRRLAYTGQSNRPPEASLTANPTSGPGPLTVTFDASASSDPDGDTGLTYLWAFGDNATAETNSATTTHTYTSPGVYTATVTVRDDNGAYSTNPTALRIDVGNSAPVPTIEEPSATTIFSVGQRLVLRGSASDVDEGPLPDSALTWRVLLHHSDHDHPYVEATEGNNISFTAPAPEDLFATADSYVTIELIATDSHGATSTISRNVQPQRVTLTFASDPPGLKLGLDGGTVDNTVTTPHRQVSWAGYQLKLEAPATQEQNGQRLDFCRWSDGQPATRELVTPNKDTLYTAIYRPAGTCLGRLPDPQPASPPAHIFLPLLRQGLEPQPAGAPATPSMVFRATP